MFLNIRSAMVQPRLILVSFRSAKHKYYQRFSIATGIPNMPGCSIAQRGVLTKPRILSCSLRGHAADTKSKINPEATESKDLEETKEFQAETKMLLDIVAKSLYSDKEVFIRELISNSSDALEKLRYWQVTESSEDIGKLEIKIFTNKQERILIIEDTGIGMTKEELVSNLGTIARSGSKAFLEEIKNKGKALQASNVIGQFGVGFYSVFMVAENVEVYTTSYLPNSPTWKWSSDGSGSYKIQEVEKGARGMKIVIHLKPEYREFADDTRVKDVIKKYSNFVNAPILIDGEQANKIQPLWIMEPKSVTPEMHKEFYQFISNSFDEPRFILHFKTDIPLSVQAMLYFPEGKPGLFELHRDSEVGVALFTRRVLIKSHADNIIPKWLRFMRGVIDSEDIPLNLSREMLQNSALISKLRSVIVSKVLRFLYDKSCKDPEAYAKFYQAYAIFLKEGIVSSDNHHDKEEIGKLLCYESSNTSKDSRVSLPEYCNRLQSDQKDIFYLAAPSRQLAECSPYLEALKEKKVEVLFCYEPHDELVLMHLKNFKNYRLTSVESEMRKSSSSGEDPVVFGPGSLTAEEAKELTVWFETNFKNRLHSVTLTKKLHIHPCVVTVEEMAAARHFMRTQAHLLQDDMKYSLLRPSLEINPRHAIVRKLATLINSNPEFAVLIAEQLYANALVTAGLLDDPRTLLKNMNNLLEMALQKH